MKDRSAFGVAGLWENWKEPATGEWIRTFCVITVPANEMVSTIHDRMPAILKPGDYDAWLAGDGNPTEMLRSFPSEPMTSPLKASICISVSALARRMSDPD
jgi:putative SOS response-associated peptidase YedK